MALDERQRDEIKRAVARILDGNTGKILKRLDSLMERQRGLDRRLKALQQRINRDQSGRARLLERLEASQARLLQRIRG